MFLPRLAVASAQSATILSVSYSCGDPVVHIGSVVTVNMAAIDVSLQMNQVSVISATSLPVALGGSLTLGSQDLATSVLSPTTVYVTDGTRTWAVAFPGGGQSQLTLTNSNLLGGSYAPANWSVPDYTGLQNQTFRVYTGSLLVGGGPGNPVMSADLGKFTTVVPNDNGNAPDAVTDGLWSGSYAVLELGFMVSGAHIYGHCTYNSLLAVNDGFQSPTSFDMDAVRPQIVTLRPSVPTLPNYNNVMYLNATCQGTANADPTNAPMRFDVVVNKVNTEVDVVLTGLNVAITAKSLPAMIVPNGAQTNNTWSVWNGDDGTGLYVPDGIYQANAYIKDIYGVVGSTRTAEVKVTSMKFEIRNISLNPAGSTAEPVLQKGLLTSLGADLVAYRNGVNQSLRPSAEALGWPDQATLGIAEGINNGNADNTFDGRAAQGAMYALWEASLIAPGSGTPAYQFSADKAHDSATHDDWDAGNNTNNAAKDSPAWLYGGGADPASFPCFNAASCSSCTCLICGDGDPANDWDPVVFTPMLMVSGVARDPTFMQARYGVNFVGPSLAQGDYRLRLRATLSGIWFSYPQTAVTNCPGTSIHFFPTLYPEGWTPAYGERIYTEDSSVIFSVVANGTLPADTTPPVFLSSSPALGATVPPTQYGPSPALNQKLKAQFQDPESSMDSIHSSATLTDPQGGLVPGSYGNDGGGSNNTLTMSFTPSVPLNKGGAYTLTVNTCNLAGLCITKAIVFNVADQTPPGVSAVELVPQVGINNYQISVNQSGPEGPFQNISAIEVTLSMPQTSTNTIDWTDSVVSLYSIAGSTKTFVSMTRTSTVAGSTNDFKLRYKLDTPINGAGLYEVDIQTYSQNAAGVKFVGPPSGVNPQFFTVVCANCLSVLYQPPGNSSARPAITGESPITLTAGIQLNPFQVGVDAPPNGANGLPVDTNWVLLSSALFEQSMRFFANGVPVTGTPMTWTYNQSVPLVFHLYYNESDLPPGVGDSNLKVRGYANGSWSTIANVTQNTATGTGNSFDFSPVSGLPGYIYYAIEYPGNSSSVNNAGATATPNPFPNTRSFNPVAGNGLNRKARFYYGTAVPKAIEARVYDTSGRLIKTLVLGNGIDLADYTQDSYYSVNGYYFQWDGTNDSGAMVRNGIYIVRWQVTRTDGSSDTQVKPVALIK